MNTLISYDQQSATASISADADLTEVSFAVEIAASNFLGRGVTRFDCTRTKQPNGTCVLSFKALKKSGPIVFSKVGAIGYLAESGLFPKNLAPNERFQLEETGFSLVSEGQHKHGGRMSAITGQKKDGSDTTSIVESYDLRPDLPVTVLSYGLSDMFTGLFALNVNYVKWQGSLKQVQLYIRHALTDKQLADFLLSNKDYDITRKVNSLS